MDTIILQLSDTCKFHLGDEPDAWQAWFDDSSFEDVYLPHDWSVHLPFSKDYSSGTGYLAGGIGWYRIHFDAKKEWVGKRVSVLFDGIYKNSRVWCNSYYLGERPNGYISFAYDITDFLHFDCDNVICVYVDRREIADSRWFTGSGITRKVSLVIEEPVHPSLYGIGFTTLSSDSEKAKLRVNAKLENTTPDDADVHIVSTLSFGENAKIATLENNIRLSAFSQSEINSETILKNPKLWSPESPDLYTLETFLSVNGGSLYLADSKKVGIRSFSFDADNGFFLNEKPYKIKGVCVHHDAGCLGAAVTPAVWYRRLKKLKKMGCNAIRMSHNPHMPELYDLCDSLGFFVMDEAFDEWEGPKNKWWQGHNVYPPKNEGYYVHFPVWHKKDLVDMILRDRNHPSIILWSIGNEIDYPNDPYCHPSFSTMTGNNDANKPASERIYNPLRPNATRLAVLSKKLSAIVKETDPSRPVTLAAAFPELSAKIGFIDPLDVVGFNYKEHLYEENHKLYPDKPFLGSENGHEYKQWKAVRDCPYISAQFLWTGIDYLGETIGWPFHGSGAGLMTVAGFEKTGYYRRQSFWSDKPMVHLATIKASESKKTAWGREDASAIDCEFSDVDEIWNYLSGEEITVKCYTNLPKVELLLNQKSLGIFEKDDRYDCILTNIPFEKGELKALGLDCDNNVITSHSLYTTGNACQIDVKEYPVLQDELPFYATMEHRHPFRNLVQLEVTMLDACSHRVYTDESLIQVSVENGSLLGIENGNLADITDYSAAFRRAYKGRLLIYAYGTNPEKPLKITMTAKGMCKTITLP